MARLRQSQLLPLAVHHEKGEGRVTRIELGSRVGEVSGTGEQSRTEQDRQGRIGMSGDEHGRTGWSRVRINTVGHDWEGSSSAMEDPSMYVKDRPVQDRRDPGRGSSAPMAPSCDGATLRKLIRPALCPAALHFPQGHL